MNIIHASGGTLAWKDEYSVNVKEIDDQHKQLFEQTNELHRMLQAHADAITLTQQVEKILASKAAHFATEEKYFHQFNFDGTAEHERLHRDFSEQIAYLQKEYASDINMLSAKLVDFLALWLVGHLMGVDQKYKQCFKDGGLQ